MTQSGSSEKSPNQLRKERKEIVSKRLTTAIEGEQP